MENTQNPIVYAVNSDLDDGILYAEFATAEEAIEYAKQHMDKLPFVDELEVSYDANGDIDNVFSYKTIWAHDEEGTATETEDDYWDDLAAMYDEEEANKHDLGDTTWFESMDNLVETLEDHEDEVECKECFDLFPKADCIKLDIGYVCPTCAECGTVSEEDTFKIDFPEYEKFRDPDDMIPAEPTIPVESDVETVPTDPENEIDPISTPEEAVPFLVNDEEEAVAGYEKAAEVVEASDLENKEEILDTIEHIKEEEEEHIEELSELVEPTEEEVPENENDPISEEEVEEIEDPEAEPVEEAMSDFQRNLIDRLTPMTKDEFQKRLESEETVTIFTGDPREIGIRSRDYEASYEDGKYVVSFWDETYNDDFTDSEVVEEFDTLDDLWAYMINFMEDDDFSPEYNYLAEELTEHVNQENPAIESDQELEGTDNAVVDCKIADVVTHSEDEKPLHEEFDRVRAAAQCSRKCYDFYNAVATNAPEKELKKHGKVAYKFVKDQFGLTGKKAEDLLISGYAVWRLLNGKSKYESLTEATADEFDEIVKLCKEIGIENGADLNRFVRDEVKSDETLLTRLRSYRSELGDEFQIKETLIEAKRDPFHEAIFEAIDYLTEFSDIFPVPGNIGANNWEELKDDINYGLSSDFEIAEIIMEYFNKDLAISRKHPEMFEDDPQSELTLETYNRLKRAYDKAVADYEAAYPEDFEEQLDLTHGYDHIKSVASIVHTAVNNYTKDNRVGTRPNGTSFYVLGDKTNSDPEKMKKLILDTLAENGYDPDVVEYVEKGNAYGYIVDQIKAMARMTMSYQESLTEETKLATNKRGDYLVKNSSGYGYSVFSQHNVWLGGFGGEDDEFAVKRFNCGDINESFTPEEMEEFNMDEDGNSLDGYDTYVRCGWCDEIFSESECGFDYHMGWLCDRCQSAITSRGEKLMIITNPTEDDFARVLGEGVELDESAILAGVATGVIVDVVKRIMDKAGDHKKKSKWIDFRKHVIEKTPEGQINIWNHDSEQVASDLKTIAAAKEKIKELNQKAKEDKKAAKKNKNKPAETPVKDEEKPEEAEVTESLTEDAEEDTYEPVSQDPQEKPKRVKMQDTASTSGMDFEAALAKFGVEVE